MGRTEPGGEQPVQRDTDAARLEQVARECGAGEDQVRAIVTAATVAGWNGIAAAAELRGRFGLDDLQPLGATLRERGLLAVDEAMWLGDRVS